MNKDELVKETKNEEEIVKNERKNRINNLLESIGNSLSVLSNASDLLCFNDVEIIRKGRSSFEALQKELEQ